MSGKVSFSDTQKQRLLELGSVPEALEKRFKSENERNSLFNYLSRVLSEQNLKKLNRLRTTMRRMVLTRIVAQAADLLMGAGFVEVATPTFMDRGLLKKMDITEDDSLWKQIFWIDKNRCLRPMLAPNLYFLLGHLQRLWPRPIRLFEIGSCWRKESKGPDHLEEFTMLNLVELGCHGEPLKRLTEITELVLSALGLACKLVEEASQVSGSTLNVICDGVEVASGAAGPHFLDKNWNISEPWASLRMGLERACMLITGNANIQQVGRSLLYLDGARLNS